MLKFVRVEDPKIGYGLEYDVFYEMVYRDPCAIGKIYHDCAGFTFVPAILPSYEFGAAHSPALSEASLLEIVNFINSAKPIIEKMRKER